MQKRSTARKASTALKHALLKMQKKRRVKEKVKELKKKIRHKELLRKSILADSKAMKSKVAQDVLGQKNSLGGLYFQAASDIGMEQAMLEKTLKRKQKQLKALKGKKR